ncbi:hypothetical protein ACI65C_011953 [Semiaphis heraclei]
MRCASVMCVQPVGFPAVHGIALIDGEHRMPSGIGNQKLNENLWNHSPSNRNSCIMETVAFQGIWYLQLTSPIYIDGQNPLKTGLLFNTFPCTNNKLEFTDTTPCDDTDYNTEYELCDISYNMYTQTTEIQKALLSPAYGKCSPYAIFNICSEKYYTKTITEINPFVDNDLIRHKIGQGICEIEYTLAVIGADKCFKEYMVLVVINQYENVFGGNPYIIFVLTRDVNPDWSIYDKAYNDIEKSNLSPNYLVSVDQSKESTAPIPSLSVPSITPIDATSDAINGVIEQNSVCSTSETKSVVSDTSSSSSTSRSTTTSTTTKSTVIIEKSTDYTCQYEFGSYDLFPNVPILKGLDDITVSKALSGHYFVFEATPCSLYDTTISRFGFLKVFFEDLPTVEWDHHYNYKMVERGLNMRTGTVEYTKSYISSVYSKDHPFGQSVFAIYTEGYYDKVVEEITPLTIDGMICKQPSDIYKYQMIATIIGYEENKFLLVSIVNQYKNPIFTKTQVPLVYCLTRERNPSLDTLNRITQEILRCELNPNYFIKIDQAKQIDDEFTFDKVDYESKVTSFSMTKSMVSTRGINIGNNSPEITLPSICPKGWNVKTFDSQCATIALQGTWYIQMTTPVYIKGNNPLKTGLLFNTFPCTNNKLEFTDTTPCDDTDYNTEYELCDISYNMYTQTTEIQKALLSPAYGKCSPYAIFNICCEKYYTKTITEINPFVDNDLIRHKIGQGVCDIEYTLAVIGADKNFKEYMVLAVINQYENVFGESPYIIFVVTRKVKPDWSTYQKAIEDIERSGFKSNILVSVDHSIESTAPIPSLTVPSITPTDATSDVINGVIEQSSVCSTSETKSVVSDTSSSSSTSSSTTTSTTTKSTVIIEKSTDYTSQYEFGSYDLCPNVQILKGLDDMTVSKALSGHYFVFEATPCSLYDTTNSRVGFLNTAYPTCSLEVFFEDLPTVEWDHHYNYKMVERGLNMRTGTVEYTKSYISSVYSKDHPFGQSVFAIYSEGYYDKVVEEITPLTIDGMICKQPSDIYKYQMIATIIGYEENKYLLVSIINQYKNLFISSEDETLVYVLTRERIPCLDTLKSITQQLLSCGVDPNHLIKMDQSYTIDEDYVFDSSSFESQTSCWSSATSSSTTTVTSSSSRSLVSSISCD